MADYHSLLMRAVANLPNSGTSATRGALYERARKALLDQLRSLRPPLPESDIIREETALDAAIAEIEDRYGPQDPAPPPAPPTSTVTGRPVPAPRAAPPPQIPSVQRPQRAHGGRAGCSLRAIAFANRRAGPSRGYSHASSGSSTATFAANTGGGQPRREPIASANPRLRGGHPRWRRLWLPQLDRSWPLQWPTSRPPYHGPAAQRRRSERQAARMKVCPG